MNVRAWLLLCLAACAPVRDEDGDGALSDVDCDDADPARFPGAPEACDAIDADCDRLPDDADEDAPRTAWYADLDGDGFGRATAMRMACAAPVAHVDNGEDCDDGHAFAWPGAVEVCDGIDGDCDGVADDDDTDLDRLTWHRDEDADGYGTDSDAVEACAAPIGFVLAAGDCVDADAAVNPGVEDTCGGGDADCDGVDDACEREGEVSLALADATLVGEAPGDAAGTHLALGDVDGDGVVDVLTSAPRAEGVAGAAWVVRGAVTGAGSLAEADLRVAGTDGEAPIAGVTAGDLDGDTLAEVVVATPASGTVWIFGAERRGALSLDEADAVLLGEGQAGAALAAGPDLDGDGRGDLVVGAPTLGTGGGVAIVPEVVGGTLADAAWRTGVSEGAEAGFAVASPGDLDGDGAADLVVGAPGALVAGEAGPLAAGAAYVLFGPVQAGSLADADARLDGTAAGDRAGAAVAGVGDIDGDGLADLLIGAPGLDAGAEDAGGAFLVRGTPSGETALADAHCTLLGDMAGAGAGSGVVALGDMDGNGRADAAVGALAANRAWLLLGPFAGTIALRYAEATFLGADPYDDAGVALAGGGDVDGDGAPDLLIGSPGADAGGSGAGIVSVLRGWTP